MSMQGRSLTRHALLLLAAGICAALLLPALFMDGMFSDGTQYAAVSRNFAEGSGTFWSPHYTQTLFPVFTEQPPLMFFLQGLFFKLFGNSMYTERVYCAVAALITAILLMRTWKLITKENNSSWYALLLWFTSPVIFYTYTENLEEGTMTVFVILAFNAVLKGLASGQHRHWLIAGGWLLAAGLTKGVQGMFLLSAPFWAWIILKQGTSKQFLTRSALIAALPALFAVVALLTPVIRDSIGEYFASRFTKTFSGETAHSRSHFHMLFELLIDALPAIALTVIMLIAGRKTPMLGVSWHGKKRMIFFLLACGFSGILPLLVTLEQRGFYLATPLPLLLLALALLAQPVALRLTHAVRGRSVLARALTAAGVLVIAGVLVLTGLLAGTPRRDAQKIAALHEIAAITGEDQIVRSTDALNSDWGFIAYGQRYHRLSFTEQNRPELAWLITEKGADPGAEYAAVPLQTPLYDLFRRK
jgi:4-amino-4-deoxy-L-arabinose transferase-like glycosyltransferase